MPDAATREGAYCASLTARDRGLLWHPYEALDGPAPHTVAAAQGVTLTLVTPDGERVEAIDGMASWWLSLIHI